MQIVYKYELCVEGKGKGFYDTLDQAQQASVAYMEGRSELTILGWFMRISTWHYDYEIAQWVKFEGG